jgi:hypothetical protein
MRQSRVILLLTSIFYCWFQLIVIMQIRWFFRINLNINNLIFCYKFLWTIWYSLWHFGGNLIQIIYTLLLQIWKYITVSMLHSRTLLYFKFFRTRGSFICRPILIFILISSSLESSSCFVLDKQYNLFLSLS